MSALRERITALFEPAEIFHVGDDFLVVLVDGKLHRINIHPWLMGASATGISIGAGARVGNVTIGDTVAGDVLTVKVLSYD